ncbi:MAG: 23S rRNA (pseudouridine(1915)-N(3))-methyltransferase RlmH [Candidatus Peregrinibacteria bacterium]|nr:23S rRNA (pseudouridine(1915)-N(3))-methyltransferase RlmH [Candidatus Peregrinibacteria bacterium]
MKIRIIQIGKTKDSYIEEGIMEFTKRLSPYVKLEIVTLKEVMATKAFTKEHCKEIEGEEILKLLGKSSEPEAIIALDEHGKEFTSMEFSKFLGKFFDLGERINFIIGGPYGLSENVRKKASLLCAFSKMTFTHQMIRIFLLEQIYRGVSIIKGKEYHNE